MTRFTTTTTTLVPQAPLMLVLLKTYAPSTILLSQTETDIVAAISMTFNVNRQHVELRVLEARLHQTSRRAQQALN